MAWRQTSRRRQTRKPTCKRTTQKQPTCKWICKPTRKRTCKPTCKPTCKRTTAKINARARTHTDITIRSWQYRPAGKAQHRRDRTNTESSGSRPADRQISRTVSEKTAATAHWHAACVRLQAAKHHSCGRTLHCDITSSQRRLLLAQLSLL